MIQIIGCALAVGLILLGAAVGSALLVWLGFVLVFGIGVGMWVTGYGGRHRSGGQR